jgi:hypothetical protein
MNIHQFDSSTILNEGHILQTSPILKQQMHQMEQDDEMPSITMQPTTIKASEKRNKGEFVPLPFQDSNQKKSRSVKVKIRT